MSQYLITFSPTGRTNLAAEFLASELGDFREIDLCANHLPEVSSFEAEDLCLIAVPSYGGRVPAVALDRMKDFCGTHTPAILLVAYGNRHYDDTFVELQDFLEKRGFQILAAVAAVTEHSIARQFATGRPNASDKEVLSQFSRQIKEKWNASKSGAIQPLALPGNRPYCKSGNVPLKPSTSRACTKCGACAKRCPVGAIPQASPDKTDKSLCISCMRCIQICPRNARKLSPLLLFVASKGLQKTCSVRKENELFI